jgi:hypothetical protein
VFTEDVNGFTLIEMARYLWALPNSLIGFLFLPLVLLTKGGCQVHDGVLELHGGFAALVLRRCTFLPGGACAMTLGHVVLGRDRDALGRTRAHERVHVRQYELWGPAFLPAYLAAALWGAALGTGAYHGDFFERQAFDVDRNNQSDAQRTAVDREGNESRFWPV